jgi:orotate phosphoribosyltransferase-like protein
VVTTTVAWRRISSNSTRLAIKQSCMDASIQSVSEKVGAVLGVNSPAQK